MARLKKFWLLGFLALFVAVSASSAAAVTVTIPNSTSTLGATTIEIPVRIDTTTGIKAFMFFITYDPAVLTCTGMATSGTLLADVLSGGDWLSIKTLTAGKMALVLAASDPATPVPLPAGPGDLLKLKFTIVGSAGSSSPVAFTNNSGATPPETNAVAGASGAIAATFTGGTCTVASASVKILSVAPSNQPVASAANTTTFAVSNTGTAGTTMAWTAAVTTGGTWLSITSGSSGTNTGTITAAFTKNTTGSTRTGTITVTATGATGSPKAVTVTQAKETGAPVLSIAPADRPVAFAANTTTFAVSNTGAGTMAWTAAVTAGGSWLSITSGGSGTNTGTITAAFTKNTTSAARTGTITVTATGATGSPKAVTVTQTPETVVLPVFSDLGFYNKAGTLITGNILVDAPIKAKGDYTAGSDGSALAMSQWVINNPTLVDAVFADTTVSGDLTSSWLPANLLEPGKAYILKGRAKNSNGTWTAWATLNFNTILQAAAADKDNDGVPDDQAPTATFIQQPDIKTIKFNKKLIQVESTDSDTITYLAGIERTLEAPPLSGSNSYGVFTTRIEVLKGTPITLTYTFPEALSSGTAWYKYDESAVPGSKWSKYPDAVIVGKTVTVELKDGGKGDADGVANGVILDPAGPVAVPVVVPVSDDDGGDKGSLPVGPLAAGISALLVWLKRRKQR